MRSIGEVIIELDSELDALGMAHAFGGALALAYYAEPRGTVDVDINVGVPYESRSTLLDHLATNGWHADESAADAPPDAGMRVRQPGETVVIDLFFSFDDFHQNVLARSAVKPFVYGGTRYELPFLSADDLIVFKISLGRPKDWVDIEAMIAAGTTIDPDYVERALVEFKGRVAYRGAARLRAMLRGRTE